MKILISGANGFLGQHLCRALKDNHEVIATGRGISRIMFDRMQYIETDILSAAAVQTLVQHVAPDVIIHTAAMSKPDECDTMRSECTNINVNGTHHFIAAARTQKKDIHFIYISSDFVLGDNGPHDESAMPAPLNFYGETKRQAEEVVERSGLCYSIVRPVFMYGEIWEGMRPTFLHWVQQSLEAGKRISVVADQHRTPTYAGDICRGIELVIGKKARGLYHFAGEEVLTPYDMAVTFANRFGLDASLIEAVDATSFPEPVRRAKKGGLIITKAKQQLGFRPLSFEEGLKTAFPPKNTRV